MPHIAVISEPTHTGNRWSPLSLSLASCDRHFIWVPCLMTCEPLLNRGQPVSVIGFQFSGQSETQLWYKYTYKRTHLLIKTVDYTIKCLNSGHICNCHIRHQNGAAWTSVDFFFPFPISQPQSLFFFTGGKIAAAFPVVPFKKKRFYLEV